MKAFLDNLNYNVLYQLDRNIPDNHANASSSKITKFVTLPKGERVMLDIKFIDRGYL